MPKEITTQAFEFEELDEQAKEKARDWYRECLNRDGDEWWDCCYEDFVTVAGHIGIEFDQNMRTIRTPDGQTKTIDDGPKISFSGFCSQGDGASFVGGYSCKPDAVAAIKEYAPEDRTLHQIAESLMAVQVKYLFGLKADVRRSSSSYCHENTVSIEVVDARDDGTGSDSVHADDEAAVIEALRDFMRWMYRQLEADNDARYTDEAVDDAITCNEYLFTKDGQRHEYA
jgi:hypothetical protein